MSAPSRGYRAAASLINSSRNPRICSQCILLTRPSLPSSYRRTYAIAVSSTNSTSSPAPPPPQNPLVQQTPPVSQTSSASSSKRKKKPSGNQPPLKPYRIQSGVLLSRPPILKRDLAPFEESFFLYQKRLNERLALPFTRYFYFKRDTPADYDYKLKAKTRNGVAARDIGGYAAYAETGWNDELLTSQKDIAKRENAVEELLKDSILRINEDGSVRVLAEGEEEASLKELRPLDRKTRSDKQNLLTRLDRALDETLYLVVKGIEGWKIPSGDIIGRESLSQAAERVLVQSAGSNMNTWILGHTPIGHRVVNAEFKKVGTAASVDASTETALPEAPSEVVTKQGVKTFFMKGRIMAGQANLSKNELGLEEFQWATKDEVKELVGKEYWHAVKGMFSDR